MVNKTKERITEKSRRRRKRKTLNANVVLHVSLTVNNFPLACSLLNCFYFHIVKWAIESLRSINFRRYSFGLLVFFASHITFNDVCRKFGGDRSSCDDDDDSDGIIIEHFSVVHFSLSAFDSTVTSPFTTSALRAFPFLSSFL